MIRATLALTIAALAFWHMSDAPARARADIRAVYGVTPDQITMPATEATK